MRRRSRLIPAALCVVSAAALGWGLTAAAGAAPVPAGATIKAGARTVCTITLKAGQGSCLLTAKEFNPGTYQLTASYPGKGGFAGSASGPKTLTVAR
jgi:hypothetical protein